MTKGSVVRLYVQIASESMSAKPRTRHIAHQSTTHQTPAHEESRTGARGTLLPVRFRRNTPTGRGKLFRITQVEIQILLGNLEGAVRRGRGGKEKEWTDCVQSEIRAFGIAGNWKVTALKAEVWVETVTEGGRRFMPAWREEEVVAARYHREKREAAKDWETCYRTRKHRTSRSDTL